MQFRAKTGVYKAHIKGSKTIDSGGCSKSDRNKRESRLVQVRRINAILADSKVDVFCLCFYKQKYGILIHNSKQHIKYSGCGVLGHCYQQCAKTSQNNSLPLYTKTKDNPYLIYFYYGGLALLMFSSLSIL